MSNEVCAMLLELAGLWPLLREVVSARPPSAHFSAHPSLPSERAPVRMDALLLVEEIKRSLLCLAASLGCVAPAEASWRKLPDSRVVPLMLKLSRLPVVGEEDTRWDRAGVEAALGERLARVVAKCKFLVGDTVPPTLCPRCGQRVTCDGDKLLCPTCGVLLPPVAATCDQAAVILHRTPAAVRKAVQRHRSEVRIVGVDDATGAIRYVLAELAALFGESIGGTTCCVGVS